MAERGKKRPRLSAALRRTIAADTASCFVDNEVLGEKDVATLKRILAGREDPGVEINRKRALGALARSDQSARLKNSHHTRMMNAPATPASIPMAPAPGNTRGVTTRTRTIRTAAATPGHRRRGRRDDPREGGAGGDGGGPHRHAEVGVVAGAQGDAPIGVVFAMIRGTEDGERPRSRRTGVAPSFAPPVPIDLP